MSNDQFTSIMVYLSSEMVRLISQSQNISEEAALKKLYFSKLYALLEKEETKLWQNSIEMLYHLFVQEQETGEFQLPNVEEIL